MYPNGLLLNKHYSPAFNTAIQAVRDMPSASTLNKCHEMIFELVRELDRAAERQDIGRRIKS